jgi:thiol peroxidase
VTFSGNPITLLGDEIKIGDIGSDFTVVDSMLHSKSLKDFDGKIKVISVFPSIDTGVCEYQVTWFNQEASKFSNVVVLNISVDLPFALDRFCSSHNIKSSLTLSDYKDLDFGLKYGFVIEELRLLTRGVIILDQENKVRYVEYVKELTEHPKYELAIEKLKSLAEETGDN